MPRPQRLTQYASLVLVTCLVLLLSLRVLTANAAVIFSEFKAAKQPDGSILVKWTTASELNSPPAFNLYRATSVSFELDEAHLIHQEEAQGSGTTGFTYQYVDAAVESGMCYYYRIAELTSSGSLGSEYGPTAAGDNCATVDATPTATRTATATTAAGAATATATRAATSVIAQATATRQFANTPTTAPTLTPGPGVTWTPAPGATPLPGAQIATPTPAPGAAATNPAAVQAEIPTIVPTPQPEPSATATRLMPTETTVPPAATNTPQVFAAATSDSALLGANARLTPTPAPSTAAGRNSRLMLLLGGGAIVLAGLLGVGGLLIWRASRPQ